VLEHDDELVTRVAAELKRPVHLDSALDARVMAEVRALPLRPRVWWLRPRSFSLTPMGILARAAVLAAVAVGATLVGTRTRPAADAVAAATQSGVSFVLYAPGASSVALVGDFNGWDTTATRLQATGSAGAWVVTVPLAPGRYRYAFLIDGSRWLADPGAPRAPDDDFGTPNSVLTVGS
jgi:hypothetical protein